jgi:hypothetical protein
MKFLGSMIIFFGLGTIVSSLFKYFLWFQLKVPHPQNGTLPEAEMQFVKDYGHGFFLTAIVLGILIIFGGFKVFRRRIN